jgi:hypothetical protein
MPFTRLDCPKTIKNTYRKEVGKDRDRWGIENASKEKVFLSIKSKTEHNHCII